MNSTQNEKKKTKFRLKCHINSFPPPSHCNWLHVRVYFQEILGITTNFLEILGGTKQITVSDSHYLHISSVLFPPYLAAS